MTGAYPEGVMRPAAAPAGDARNARLAQTIEAEIIPRLMLAHQLDVVVPTRIGGETAGDLDVAEFTQFVLSREAAVVTAHVASLLERGMTVEASYLDLLAPAARRLGDLWTQDLVDFTDVTIGLSRLHHVMTSIGAMKLSRSSDRMNRPRALFISMPDETHNFGLFMVANFFRRANWDVRVLPFVRDQDLAAMIRTESRDVVGVSAGCSDQLDRVRATIGLIRKISRNRAVKIMAGGPCFIDNPRAAEDIGADATSPDGFGAVEAANGLIQFDERACWRESA